MPDSVDEPYQRQIQEASLVKSLDTSNSDMLKKLKLKVNTGNIEIEIGDV